MIDLRSDTVTKPTDEMREAARAAEVGDDVYGEDPTVNELESTAAALLEMDAALFVPSGTMGNQIAARTHTARDQEVIVERESHVYRWELGGLAVHSGLQVRPLDGGDRGIFTPEQLGAAFIGEDAHRAGTGLVCLENTHNGKGGTVVTPSELDSVVSAAHDFGVPVHLDGARLWNAATALDVPVHRLTRSVDSVMVSLSKGLGAPIGSILAGQDTFIERARRNRKLFGGGMRQAGLVAAPGLVALENRGHLAIDHENAHVLAAGLGALDGVSVDRPETNIVLVDTSETEFSAGEFVTACEGEGVLCSAFGSDVVRFCSHRDVDRADVERAGRSVERALSS